MSSYDANSIVTASALIETRTIGRTMNNFSVNLAVLGIFSFVSHLGLLNINCLGELEGIYTAYFATFLRIHIEMKSLENYLCAH